MSYTKNVIDWLIGIKTTSLESNFLSLCVFLKTDFGLCSSPGAVCSCFLILVHVFQTSGIAQFLCLISAFASQWLHVTFYNTLLITD